MGAPQRPHGASRPPVGQDRPARRPRHLCLLRQHRLVSLPVQGRAPEHEPQHLALGRQRPCGLSALGQLLQRGGTFPPASRQAPEDHIPVENHIRHQQVAEGEQQHQLLQLQVLLPRPERCQYGLLVEHRTRTGFVRSRQPRRHERLQHVVLELPDHGRTAHDPQQRRPHQRRPYGQHVDHDGADLDPGQRAGDQG